MVVDRDNNPVQAEKRRTLQQNKALYLWFTQLADNLNEQGFDMRRTLKAHVDIPWNAETIKEYIFRPIMRAQLNKESTTELTTKEIDAVFDTISKHLGENIGVHQDFPSIETQLHEMQARRR